MKNEVDSGARMGLGLRIKKRSFSFMLARRYLNPRRAVLSSFTLISLIGVLLGVLVLVVVMAGFAGIERDVKAKLLGFTPHILVYTGMEAPANSQEEGSEIPAWQLLAKDLLKVEGVKAATAHISDNVILDVGSWQKPVSFRGVDTSDPNQVSGVAKMLDLDNFPESNSDLGLDDRAVVSSLIAGQFGLRVGDTMRLYSTRNFDSVMDAYKVTEKPVVRAVHAEPWEMMTKVLQEDLKQVGDGFEITSDKLIGVYDSWAQIHSESFRELEKVMVFDLLKAMESGEPSEDKKIFRFSAENKAKLIQAYEALSKTDESEMDGEILKGIKNLVLPKEVQVIGVYAASQMAVTPDIFVPLPLAQDLAGLTDGVQGVALRLEDPYQAEPVAIKVREYLGSAEYVKTWGDEYKPFFQLISQQRVMMYFVLSFIVLISAFSMMAVMFTVTIQKRREIGVMKALGAAPIQIVKVFLYQGMLLGFLGAVLGVGIGRLVIYFRGYIQEAMRVLGFDPFSESLTGSGVIPVYNNPVEQLVIGLMAFVLCSLAALVPAFFAARSDAAKSLRNL
ncbi:MAG: ABC transporter permease [Akkermansiaceae bacterium]|jgi:lipoprotein-releasing system permease protein